MVFGKLLACKRSKKTVDKSVGNTYQPESEFPEKTKGGFETMIKNLKKVISTLAAVAILATSASAFAVSFPDVDKSASYAGAVDALTTLGIVNGDDNGLFNPENTVTRAEFAKMVVEALGAGNEAASSTDTKFVDAKGHWAAGYIETGVAKEFINGYDETTFGPDDKVTYAQAVKMLVAAIGYDTYASKQGGWPSGYLAYGSQLDIIAGVTGVTNDTALTRAQCAVLVYNTLKAPICIIDGYYQEYDGNGLAWIPNYVPQDGEHASFKSLLTEKHNAYVVKGRVNSVPTVDAVKGDTVQFSIELTENFDGVYDYKAAAIGDKDETVYVDSAIAKDLLFVYSEAIIKKDKDTGDYSVVSIIPYGSLKTVEVALKDVKPANLLVNDNGTYYIKVDREGTVKTTDYKVDASATDSATKVYVNGIAEGKYAAAAGAPAAYLTSKTATAKLVRANDVASTSADDVYDYVMVSYYGTGRVTSVTSDDETAVIKVQGINGLATEDLEIDLEKESEQKITFIKDGVEISYSDVKKNDIVSVAYDFDSTDWTKDDELEIIVSDKIVSGTVTGKNTSNGKRTITVDGTVYDVVSSISMPDLGNTYDLYLDSFGCVVRSEAVATSKTLGIVASVYKSAAGDWSVKLITADGEIKTYPAKADDAADIITAVTTDADGNANANKAKNGQLYAGLDDNGTDGNTSDDTGIVAPEDAVIEYRVDSNGYVKMKAEAEVSGGAAAKFQKEFSVIGGYAISDAATKMVAVGDYFTNGTGTVAAMTMDQLEDEATYEAYVANLAGDFYGFAFVVGDLAALRPTSTLAVVQATGTQTTLNGEPVNAVTVAVNGEEDVEVYFETTTGIVEGAIIMYTVGAEGFVETGDFKVIHTPKTTATAMYDAVLAQGVTDFATVAGGAVAIKTVAANGYTLKGSSYFAEDEDVDVYYGPVDMATETSLSVFTKKTDAAPFESSFAEDTKRLSIANANVYTYNYSKPANDNQRVSASGVEQDRDFFNLENASVTTFTWATLVDNNDPQTPDNTSDDDYTLTNVKAKVAFVRVVDDIVTDVVYYVAK